MHHWLIVKNCNYWRSFEVTTFLWSGLGGQIVNIYLDNVDLRGTISCLRFNLIWFVLNLHFVSFSWKELEKRKTHEYVIWTYLIVSYLWGPTDATYFNNSYIFAAWRQDILLWNIGGLLHQVANVKVLEN